MTLSPPGYKAPPRPWKIVGGLAHNRTIKQFGDTPTKSPRPRRTRATKGERKLHRSVSATRTITHLVCAAKRLNRRETRVAHPARPLCETSTRKVIHDTTRGRKSAHKQYTNKRTRREGAAPLYPHNGKSEETSTSAPPDLAAFFSCRPRYASSATSGHRLRSSHAK